MVLVATALTFLELPEGPVFALASHICTVTVTPELLLFATSNSIKMDFKPFGVVYTAVGNPLSAETFVLIAMVLQFYGKKYI